MLPYDQIQQLTADRTLRLQAQAEIERQARALRLPRRLPSRLWKVVHAGARVRAHEAAPGH